MPVFSMMQNHLCLVNRFKDTCGNLFRARGLVALCPQLLLPQVSSGAELPGAALCRPGFHTRHQSSPHANGKSTFSQVFDLLVC